MGLAAEDDAVGLAIILFVIVSFVTAGDSSSESVSLASLLSNVASEMRYFFYCGMYSLKAPSTKIYGYYIWFGEYEG